MENENSVSQITSILSLPLFRIIIMIAFLYLLKAGYYMPDFFLLILIIVLETSAVWSKAGLKGLDAEVTLKPYRLFPGDSAVLSVNIRNRKRLPAFIDWNQALPEILEPVDKKASGQVYLGAYDEISEGLLFTAGKRGFYDMPGLRLISRDVFGLYHREKNLTDSQQLAVYPRLIDLESVGFWASDFGGLTRDERPYLFDPIMFVGLRDYTPDMPAMHINWKASAHKDKLLSRITESSSSLTICVAIDVEAFMIPEPDEEGFEKALSVAASLSVWADEARIPFGLVTNAGMTGKKGAAVVPVNRGGGQCGHVLETLARAELRACETLERILAVESFHIPWGTAMIILGPACPVLTPSAIRQVIYYGGLGHAE